MLLSSVQAKLRKCERCGKYKRRLYSVENMMICSDCLRGMAFYEALKDGFRDPSLRGDAVIVGMNVGDATWFNPFAQAWTYPLFLWIYFKTKREDLPLYLDDLESAWRYKTPLDRVLKVYIEEGIFRIVESDGRKIIVEGDALKEMLKKYHDRQDVLDIVGAWVSGLIIARLHEEASAPDFRAVNAIVNAIADKLVDADGNIKGEPYTKIASYRCRVCGAMFATKEETRRHLMAVHRVPSDEVMMHIEEERIVIGYLLDYEYLLDVLKREGVSRERFVERMLKFRILVHEDPETPWMLEREGKRYLVVHPAWVRVLARTRAYERELLRERERVK